MNKWLDRSLIVGPYLTLCLSEDHYNRVMRYLAIDQPWSKWVTDGANATMHSMTHDKNGLCCVVCLKPKDTVTGVQIASILVHEAVHVVERYMEYINEDHPSSEFLAYSIQNVAQELMQSYAEQTAKQATDQESADILLRELLRGVYRKAGVEIPKSIDVDVELKRLTKGLKA